MKKLICLFLSLITAASALTFAGCAQSYEDPTLSIKTAASRDKYRNYYEIFVGSFCDSNGDGVGDIQGIISKLDYLNDGDPNSGDDLGVDGIWLTPIMPSQSYHKYDVEDYYDIDPDFGTLEDFDELIAQCHKRGIKVIIDMVLNHCSKFMPLFENACRQAVEGNLDDDARYFEIDRYSSNPGNIYTPIGNDYYYESNFSPYMPEWNLSADCTRDYFTDVARFWLTQHNADGFRLDATKYYDSRNTKGAEFLKWYYSAVKEIKPDVYMVGENWTGNAQIQSMYESGIDSFFAFGFAGATGGFVNAVRNQSSRGLVASLQKYERKTKEVNPGAINGYFLSNHDQVRSGNYLRGVGQTAAKMAAAVYMLTPGNSYIYYGEEIGLLQDSQAEGDEYKREPMIWDSEKLPDIRVNGKTGADNTQAVYGGVAQQEDDENSILNFYRRLIKIKNQNPEIARGTITGEEDFEDLNVCAFYVEYKGERLMIIHNLSREESKTLTVTEDMLTDPALRGDLVASNVTDGGKTQTSYVSFNGDSLVLPPQSTAILKAGDGQ